MDDIVITNERLLEIIIQVLDEKKEVMIPVKIKKQAVGKHLLPWNFDVFEILRVMQESYESQENIFYLSNKGRRRFGLVKWRVRTEKTELLTAIQSLPEFTTSQIREILEEIVGQKKAKRLYEYLTELREDGIIEHVRPGLFRRKAPMEN